MNQKPNQYQVPGINSNNGHASCNEPCADAVNVLLFNCTWSLHLDGPTFSRTTRRYHTRGSPALTAVITRAFHGSGQI